MKNRLARVCEILKRELSTAFTREIQFPVPLVTISSVDITPDLKQAHVFVSAIGSPSECKAVLRILTHSRALLQNAIAKRIVIKHTPHLNFHLDDAIERGTKVLALMDDLGMDIGPSSNDFAPFPEEDSEEK